MLRVQQELESLTYPRNVAQSHSQTSSKQSFGTARHVRRISDQISKINLNRFLDLREELVLSIDLPDFNCFVGRWVQKLTRMMVTRNNS